MRKKGKVIPVL